jgi:hypothetical protein
MLDPAVLFGVTTSERCAWQTLPGVRCGLPAIALDFELGCALCSDHALATLEARRQALPSAAEAIAAAERIIRRRRAR